MSNAAQAIWDGASSDADRVALRGPASHGPTGRLRERAAAVASRLREAQVAPGGRVLLVAPSVPEFAGAYFGILAAGAIAVTANTMSTPPELEHLGSDAEVAVVVGWSEVRPAPAEAAALGVPYWPLAAGLQASRARPSRSCIRALMTTLP